MDIKSPRQEIKSSVTDSVATRLKAIGVVGLGYVGLPVAVEFGRKRPVVGFDINNERINALLEGHDVTREVDEDELRTASHLELTNDPARLRDCSIFIVTVPTPIDSAKRPNLTPLRAASETVGVALKSGDIVIYESTVYPGCTREFCVPILEQVSGLRFNQDFYAGYSPERINPGDREHRLNKILKVTSGSTPEIAEEVDALYASVIEAGTFKAASIEVAEAAKVIENTQRDLNIALMNELAIIFSKMEIDTADVLEAASTKWNFLNFKPGLVGGHCIGVDPYYLTHRAQEIGYHPDVVLAGRRINDGMGTHIADRVSRLMMKKGISVVGSRVLVLGITFKENCPDLRNSKAIDVVNGLKEVNARVDVCDPWALPDVAISELGIELLQQLPNAGKYDAIILCVGHRDFRTLQPADIRKLAKSNSVIFDVAGALPRSIVDGRL